MKNKSTEYIGKQFSTHLSLFNDHGVALILLLNDVEICHLCQFYWLREKRWKKEIRDTTAKEIESKVRTPTECLSSEMHFKEW